MNQLIKQYRELKGLRLNIETKLLASKYPLYDQLPLMGKVEVFTQVSVYISITSSRNFHLFIIYFLNCYLKNYI